MNIQRKRFDLEIIATNNLKIREEFELDKHVKKVKGILFTADREDQLYHRGTVSVVLSGEEIITEDVHARLLMSGLGVAPSQRFLPLDVLPGNGKVKVNFSDNDHPLIAFQPYNVSVYLELEYDEAAE